MYLGGPGGPSTSPVTLAPQGPSFGASVASAGDVNGDGFGDVIVGADNGAYVYLGGPGGLSATPITVVNPAFPEGSFGVTVASAGDVNGDGFADVIVGAWFVGGGAAYAYLGGAGGLSTTPAVLTGPGGPTGASEQFGSSVASAGDVNGDGFGDVVVGAFDQGAPVYLYLGGAGGLADMPSVLYGADTQLRTYSNGTSAGDVNGDGYARRRRRGIRGVREHPVRGSHLGVSWRGRRAGGYADCAEQPRSGRCRGGRGGCERGWLLGRPRRRRPGQRLRGGRVRPSWRSRGALDYALHHADRPGGSGPQRGFGRAVASAGDVNGDGFADIVVGALDGANSYAGAAYVYTGEAAGLSTNPTVLIAPEVPNGYFGYAVATAGDVERGGTVSCRSRRTT